MDFLPRDQKMSSKFLFIVVNGQVKTDPFGISLKCLGTEYLSRLLKFKKKLLMKKGRSYFRDGS